MLFCMLLGGLLLWSNARIRNKIKQIIRTERVESRISPPHHDWTYKTHPLEPEDVPYPDIVIDYSKPNSDKRLYIYNDNHEVIHRGRVFEGKGTYEDNNSFSNTPNSHKSSLGVFVTNEFGKMNLSAGRQMFCIKLDGLSKSNYNARRRGIYIHGALRLNTPYWPKGTSINPDYDSLGCIAVDSKTLKKIKQLCLEKDKLIIVSKV